MIVSIGHDRDSSKRVKTEIREWLLENCNSFFHIAESDMWKIKVFLERDADAVAFKMFFHGHDIPAPPPPPPPSQPLPPPPPIIRPRVPPLRPRVPIKDDYDWIADQISDKDGNWNEASWEKMKILKEMARKKIIR
jgi:hypothetical protein